MKYRKILISKNRENSKCQISKNLSKWNVFVEKWNVFHQKSIKIIRKFPHFAKLHSLSSFSVRIRTHSVRLAPLAANNASFRNASFAVKFFSSASPHSLRLASLAAVESHSATLHSPSSISVRLRLPPTMLHSATLHSSSSNPVQRC